MENKTKHFDALCDKGLKLISEQNYMVGFSYMSQHLDITIEGAFYLMERLRSDGLIAVSSDNRVAEMFEMLSEGYIYYLTGKGYAFIADGGYSNKAQNDLLKVRKTKLEIVNLKQQMIISILALIISIVSIIISLKDYLFK